jgi:4-hydroxy-3-methylbut-2-enyl diphosphate reductase IspH
LFIEDCDEITSIDKTVKSIGLTAGCSTPIFQIDAVVKKLKELQI